MYTPWLREGPLYKSVSNKCKGPNCGFYSSHFWVIIKFRLEVLSGVLNTSEGVP